MRLLVIRHAIAEDEATWAATGEPDERRPLTRAGRKKMRRAARGLRRVVRAIALLGTSPLVRAVQTAEIVARVYGRVTPLTIDALTPERPPADFLAWLADAAPGRDVIAVVGHEPHLSGLVSWLLGGRDEPSFVELEKGAACLLRFDGEPAKGSACLEWLLPPRELRRLGDA
jgi:phosphohistidine phosphatase